MIQRLIKDNKKKIIKYIQYKFQVYKGQFNVNFMNRFLSNKKYILFSTSYSLKGQQTFFNIVIAKKEKEELVKDLFTINLIKSGCNFKDIILMNLTTVRFSLLRDFTIES